jgi:hypothetical protein
MKARLNITIENTLLLNVKSYASRQKISVSELVEQYFLQVIKPIKRKNIIHLVEELDAPNLDTTANLKDLFYQQQAKKNGF